MRKTRHLLFLLLVLSLVASACGARLSKEQVAAANGANAGGGTAAGAKTGTAPGTKTSTPGAATGSGAAAPTQPGAAPAAGADPNAAAPGADPAAQGAACAPAPGSTDPGVSDTEIKLGNISTISGPVPGFGQTGQNAVKAYFNYINSQGGVCGRKLTLVTSDDRLDAGTNRSETDRLKNEVFGFVGDTTVVDDGGADVLTGTNIADCSLAIGTKRNSLPNSFSPNPIDPSVNTNGTVGIFTWLKNNMGLTKVAVVYPAQADARTRGQAYIADVQAAGLAVAGPYEVAVTETNYAGVASKIKTDQADGVITTLEVNGMAKLAQAFKQIGYTPKVPFYGAQAYGQQFLSLAGDAAEGTILPLTYDIFEDADKNPAVATFVEWYQRSNPGSKPDFFSVMSWAAADMMVQGIEAAGPTPTRDKVLAALGTLTAFDAHGFLAPRNPPAKKIGDQFLVVKVIGGKWVRQFPDSGFSAG